MRVKQLHRLFSIMVTLTITMLTIQSCSTIKALCGGYDYSYSTAFCYKGQWSQWERLRYDQNEIESITASNNDIIGIKLRDYGGNVYFEFVINNYKRGQASYTGTVSYYVNDFYPTAEELAKYKVFIKPDYRTDRTPSVKRTAKATIKVVNKGKKPATFNLWFDNIGVGIDTQNVYWTN